MVCETANYKYIEERDKKFAQREESLGDWVKEKSERKAALKELKNKTRRASVSKSRSNSVSRSRSNSISMTASRSRSNSLVPESLVSSGAPNKLTTNDSNLTDNTPDKSL